MSLLKTISRWDKREKSENIPFTAAELQEWKESNNGKKAKLENIAMNRKERRQRAQDEAKEDAGKPLYGGNNRRSPKRRKRVFLKMAWFAMQVQDKIMRRK